MLEMHALLDVSGMAIGPERLDWWQRPDRAGLDN
jgi:hypothetical protein